MKKTKIVACVCTRNRPLMVADCLYWLRNQYIPDGCSLDIVVIDNNDAPVDWLHGLVSVGVTGPAIHCVHEPRQGLSQARNAALAKAYNLGADWIAFIDDDEIPDTQWIYALYMAAIAHCADVVHGRVKWSYPVDAGHWRCIDPWGQVGNWEGQHITHASTGNVMFRAALTREKGLWFDEALGFRGGEDTAFFRQLHQGGAQMVFTNVALVTEQVPWERVTLRGHWRKSFRNGTFKVEDGAGYWTAARRVISGSIRMLSPNRRAWLKGMRRVAEGLGMLYALSGRKYEYYKEVTGE